jgi:hypothetical protein
VSWSTNTFSYPGSITSATWNGTAVGAIYGGTAQSAYTTGDILYASAANTLSKLAIGSNTQVLTVVSGAPAWAAASSSMVYPAAGIANSTGTAWGTSYSTTGSGSVVALATSPSFTTPTLGVASATSINKVAITAPATSATLTLADTSTLATSGAFSITLTSTAATNVTLPTSGTLVNTAVATLSSLTSVGTIGTGTWQGTAVGPTYGGTGQTAYTTGDILYASATNTLSKLTAGTNGYVLTLAAGVPTWAASGGGGGVQGGFTTSPVSYYPGWGLGGSVGGAITPTTSRVYYSAFTVGATTTFTKMGLNVLTAESGKVARLGIYNWSSGKATTRVLDAGTVSLTSTGVIEVTISQSLSAGIYAIAMISDATTASIRAASTSSTVSSIMYGMTDLNSATTTTTFYEAGSGSTLPSTATTTPLSLQTAPALVVIRP